MDLPITTKNDSKYYTKLWKKTVGKKTSNLLQMW